MGRSRGVDNEMLAKAFSATQPLPSSTQHSWTIPKKLGNLSRELESHANGFNTMSHARRVAACIPVLPPAAHTMRNDGRRAGGSTRQEPLLSKSLSSGGERMHGGQFPGGYNLLGMGSPPRTMSRFGQTQMKDPRHHWNPDFVSSVQIFERERKFQLQDRDMPGLPKMVPHIDGKPNPEGLLGTLGVPPVSFFHVSAPPGGGNMPHSGLVLPSVYQSTASLFGSAANKAGQPRALKCAAQTIPKGICPAYLTHDCISCSAAVVSNFKKSDVALGGERMKTVNSEYQDNFTDFLREATPIPIKFRCRNMPKAEKAKIIAQMYPPHVRNSLKRKPVAALLQ